MTNPGARLKPSPRDSNWRKVRTFCEENVLEFYGKAKRTWLCCGMTAIYGDVSDRFVVCSIGKSRPRHMEPPLKGLMCDLLWADPLQDSLAKDLADKVWLPWLPRWQSAQFSTDPSYHDLSLPVPQYVHCQMGTYVTEQPAMNIPRHFVHPFPQFLVSMATGLRRIS